MAAVCILTANGACSLNLDYLESGADGGAPSVATADADPGPDAQGSSTFDVPGNLLRNGGFESGLSPWITWDGASITTTETVAHSGMCSALVTHRTQTYQGPVQDITPRVLAGHHYNGEAWALVGAGETDGGLEASDTADSADAPTDDGDEGRPDGAGHAGQNAKQGAAAALEQQVQFTAKIGCLQDGTTTFSYVQIGSTMANSTGWVSIAGGFVVPECTVSSVSVYVEGPAAGVDLYVDDVSVAP